MSVFIGHLERLGGVIAHPRRTLSRALFEGEGSLFEIVPWMVLVSVAAGPVRAGNALLIARLDALDGARAFLALFADRIATPLIAAIVAGSVLHLLDRTRRPAGEGRVGFDAAVDACGLALVPYLVATAVGVVLSSLGFDVWFLPHHPLAGRGVPYAARLALAYGWSAALFSLMVVEVSRDRVRPAAG